MTLLEISNEAFRLVQMNKMLELVWESSLPLKGHNESFGEPPADGDDLRYYMLSVPEWEAIQFTIFEIGRIASQITDGLEDVVIASRDAAQPIKAAA